MGLYPIALVCGIPYMMFKIEPDQSLILITECDLLCDFWEVV